MIHVYYGDDRVKISETVRQVLGEGYEVTEEMEVAEMPSVFMGTTLFDETRKILIKDLSLNEEAWEKLPEYLATPHEVVVWEEKIDGRTKTYKALEQGAEVRAFKLPEVNRGLAFDIYDMAMKDGRRAVEMLKKAEETEDPMMFLGAWAWKAVKNYEQRGGLREKRALKELSRIDMLMKTTSLTQPWELLTMFLLGLSS